MVVAVLGCGGAPAPRSVLLVTIDTLRADHVGAYGHAEARTPVMDGLAARGVRFAQTVSPAPITLPAHASLLTGKIPPFHGLRDNGAARLHDAHATLAERLRAAGLSTGAFVGAYVLDASFGLDQGFDVYDDRMAGDRSGAIGFAERSAGAVVEAAGGWLAGLPPGRRFFAWVHFYDPHADYEPPPGFRAALPGRPYDAEIAYVDYQLGRLLEHLAARGELGETLVVVTADHGEGLGEHGEPTHTRFIYDATQLVPLILAGPGLPEGAVVEAQARLVDVAPTVLELLDLEPLADAQGASLVPAMRGGEPPPGDAYLETLATVGLGWSPLVGVRRDGIKYIRAPRPELYDLERDPGELENRLAERPALAESLDSALDAMLEGASAPHEEVSLDAEGRRRLEALGYVARAGTPAARGGPARIGGVDPKDGIAAERQISRLPRLLDRGEFRAALGVVERLRGRFPDGLFFVRFEALLRLRLGQPERAAELAARLTRERPSDVEAWILRAEAEAARGRIDAARSAVAAARALQPANPLVPRAAVSIELETGRPEQARLRVDEALAADPSDPELLALRGRVQAAEGDRAAARRTFERVLEDSPDHPEAAFRLALFEIADGEAAAGAARLARVPESKRASLSAGLRIARAFARAGEVERALAAFVPFVGPDAWSAAALDAYGAFLLEIGRRDDAERALRRALALEPGRPSAANNLASLLAERGRDLDLALSLASDLAGAVPGPFAADTLAEVHLARGEARQALEAARRGLDGAETAAVAHLKYLEGRALAALGRLEEARSSLEHALGEARHPQPAWAADARQLLAKL